VVSIRTFSDPFYTQTTALDGVEYVLEFRYNQREDAWYFSISLPNGTLLAAGIKVICNIPLLRKWVDTRLPKGTLAALSKTKDTSPPGLNELGEDARVTLVYTSESELG